MRPKSLILLALALGCGLVASIGISQVLDGSNRPAAVETAPIYVALQNVNVGDPLTEKMVALEEWPKDKVPVGAITKWEDLEDRRPRTNIYQGEPLLANKLLGKGERSDPIQGVPAGMRLKTISVDARNRRRDGTGIDRRHYFMSEVFRCCAELQFKRFTISVDGWRNDARSWPLH